MLRRTSCFTRIVLTVILLLISSLAFASWTTMPGLEGGHVYGLATIPNGTVFAGCIPGGLYQSTDNGAHWQLNSFETDSVGAIECDHNGTLYINVIGHSTFHSSDGGVSWIHSNDSLPDGNNYHFQFDSTGNVYYSVYSYYPSMTASLYRSTNHGMSWQNISQTALPASAGYGVFPNGTIFNVGETNGAVWRSTNYGVTWDSTSVFTFGVDELIGFTAKNDTIGYAFFRSGIIYQTYNGGRNWTALTPSIGSTYGCYFDGNHSVYLSAYTQYYVFDINTAMLSQHEIPYPMHTFSDLVHRIVPLGDGGAMVASTLNGILRTNNGTDWAPSNSGMNCSEVGLILPCTRDTLFVYNNGRILKTYDNGNNWVADTFYDQFPIRTHSGLLLTMRTRSTDNGVTWTVFYNAMGTYHSTLSLRIYVTLDSTYIWSDDDGGTWHSRTFHYTINDIAETPDRILWIGCNNGLYVRNADSSWTRSSIHSPVTKIEVHRSGALLVATDSALYNGYGIGTLHSIWNEPVNSMTFETEGGFLFASRTGSNRVWRATQGGDFIVSYGDGLPDVDINTIVYDTITGYIYAGTVWRGLYRNDATMGVNTGWHEVGVPKGFALEQCYPNPFNPTTTISFSLPKPTIASLKVYDIQGRVVATLLDGPTLAGRNQIQFDGTKLASGVYFVNLRAGDFSAVKRITLLK